MSGGYPLFSLLPELLSLGSDKPSSVHIKEFGMLFRTKIEAMFFRSSVSGSDVQEIGALICQVSSEPT